jgi:hypothetical protein
MKIKYLTVTGKIVEPKTIVPTSHQDNLKILEDNKSLCLKIMESTGGIIEEFINNIHNSGNGYIHSGAAAKRVCSEANLLQDSFHHGLAGSALNKNISDYQANFCIIASKGEGQKWFDYFNEKN